MDNWTAVKDVAKEIRPAKGQRLDVVVGEPEGSRFAVTMTGDEKAVHEARKTVLRAYYEIEHGSVAVDASAVLNAAGMPDEDLLHLLGEVAESTGVALMLTDFTEAEGQVGAGIDARSGRDTNRTFYVLFWGDQDAVARARVQLTSVMAFRRHQHVHVLSVPLSVQPLVAGPLRSNIATIEAVSGASFTTYEHLPRLLGSARPVSEQADAALDTMYIHGQAPAGVSLARALASEVRASTPTIVRECAVSHAKLDQLAMSSRASALPDISSRYGTFIQLPHLGAGECLVRVQGASQYSVDRTIAELMSLCCDIYEVDYFPKDKLSPEVVQRASRVAAASGAVVSVNSSGAHVIGPRDAVKAAVSGLADTVGTGTVSYRIEVPTEHRDFVVGRKNGKIQRVTQTSHTTVTFTPFTEHNFYVELRADTPQAACDGLELLEDELPYETNLYIHESYHKQIIGAGGERILGIMKRSQVFIKFDVPEDRYPNACSYHKPDNVVIRCPAKNARNITQAIADLRAEADAYARQYSRRTVRMTRSHRRLLLRDSVPAMHDVELKTGAVIGFPDTDAAAVSHVSVSAMGHNADQAATMLAALFPSDYEFKVARSARFPASVSESPDSQFTARVAVPLRIAYGVEVQIDPPAAGAAGGLAHRMPWHRIVLTYAKTKRPALNKAVEVLTVFLRECGLDIIDRADVKPEHIVAEAPQPLPAAAPMARGRSLNALDANSTNMLPAMNFKPPAHHYGGENMPHEPRGPPSPVRVQRHSRSQSAFPGYQTLHF